MAIYINGELQSFKSMTGTLRKTTFPLLMGQMLPDNSTYNFKGTLDEVSINGNAFTPTQIHDEFMKGMNSAVNEDYASNSKLIDIRQFTNNITIQLTEGVEGPLMICLCNIMGQVIETGMLEKGSMLEFDIQKLSTGMYTISVIHPMKLLTYPFLKT
jgi:hypothetical protein